MFTAAVRVSVSHIVAITGAGSGVDEVFAVFVLADHDEQPRCVAGESVVRQHGHAFRQRAFGSGVDGLCF
jgi:hypothetical protein